MPQAPQTPSSQQQAADLLDDTLNLIHQGVLEVALVVEVAGNIAGPGDGAAVESARQVHPERIHLWSHSIAGLGMNSSISSYLPRSKKPGCWQSSTGSSTTSTDRIPLPRGERPWKSSSNGKRPDQPTSSHRNWSTKGGHVRGLTKTGKLSTRHPGEHPLRDCHKTHGLWKH